MIIVSSSDETCPIYQFFASASGATCPSTDANDCQFTDVFSKVSSLNTISLRLVEDAVISVDVFDDLPKGFDSVIDSLSPFSSVDSSKYIGCSGILGLATSLDTSLASCSATVTSALKEGLRSSSFATAGKECSGLLSAEDTSQVFFFSMIKFIRQVRTLANDSSNTGVLCSAFEDLQGSLNLGLNMCPRPAALPLAYFARSSFAASGVTAVCEGTETEKEELDMMGCFQFKECIKFKPFQETCTDTYDCVSEYKDACSMAQMMVALSQVGCKEEASYDDSDICEAKESIRCIEDESTSFSDSIWSSSGCSCGRSAILDDAVYSETTSSSSSSSSSTSTSSTTLEFKSFSFTVSSTTSTSSSDTAAVNSASCSASQCLSTNQGSCTDAFVLYLGSSIIDYLADNSYSCDISGGGDELDVTVGVKFAFDDIFNTRLNDDTSALFNQYKTSVTNYFTSIFTNANKDPLLVSAVKFTAGSIVVAANLTSNNPLSNAEVASLIEAVKEQINKDNGIMLDNKVYNLTQPLVVNFNGQDVEVDPTAGPCYLYNRFHACNKGRCEELANGNITCICNRGYSGDFCNVSPLEESLGDLAPIVIGVVVVAVVILVTAIIIGVVCIKRSNQRRDDRDRMLSNQRVMPTLYQDWHRGALKSTGAFAPRYAPERYGDRENPAMDPELANANIYSRALFLDKNTYSHT